MGGFLCWKTGAGSAGIRPGAVSASVLPLAGNACSLSCLAQFRTESRFTLFLDCFRKLFRRRVHRPFDTEGIAHVAPLVTPEHDLERHRDLAAGIDGALPPGGDVVAAEMELHGVALRLDGRHSVFGIE